MGDLLWQQPGVNQAVPWLILSTHAVDPTEGRMALRTVPFGFILMDYFSSGWVPWVSSPNSHPLHCVTYPSGSGEDDQGKGTWQRRNDEAGQASPLLLRHLGRSLQHSTSRRHTWPCCSLLLRGSQTAASVRAAQLLVG